AMLALDLGAHALLAAGSAAGVDSGRERLARLWASGHALERLRAMVVAQGGDPAVCDDPAGVLPVAPVTVTAAAAATGTVTAIPARAVGEVVAVLGAGRRGNDATVDPATGVQLQVA